MDPGNFKTDPNPASAIEDYLPLNTIVAGFVGQMNGNQPGDPQKAVTIMIDVVKSEGVAEGKELPARLPLGSDIFEKLIVKHTQGLEVLKEWGELIKGTDIEGEEKGDMRTVVKEG